MKNKKFKYIVLESPYFNLDTAIMEANKQYALDCCHHAFHKKEEVPYASHQHIGPFTDDRFPEQRNRGIQAGFEIGDLIAEQTAVYVDRGISAGMILGVEHAREIGRPIVLRSLKYDVEVAYNPKHDLKAQASTFLLAAELNFNRYHNRPKHPPRVFAEG